MFNVGDMVRYYKVPQGATPDYGIVVRVMQKANSHPRRYVVMWFESNNSNSYHTMNYYATELVKVEANDV
jgi:hypothetical protein